jgi:DNA-binding PadR family transcriptional regulator
MHHSDFAGIEVSAKELLVALRRGEQTLPRKSFSNTPEGHRAVVRYLARKGRRVRVCMESPASMGWTWRCGSTSRQASK